MYQFTGSADELNASRAKDCQFMNSNIAIWFLFFSEKVIFRKHGSAAQCKKKPRSIILSLFDVEIVYKLRLQSLNLKFCIQC